MRTHPGISQNSQFTQHHPASGFRVTTGAYEDGRSYLYTNTVQIILSDQLVTSENTWLEVIQT